MSLEPQLTTVVARARPLELRQDRETTVEDAQPVARLLGRRRDARCELRTRRRLPPRLGRRARLLFSLEGGVGVGGVGDGTLLRLAPPRAQRRREHLSQFVA